MANEPKINEPMDIVVVAGMSGAGKTVAIKALEDCGYYPLDHLPADTLSTVLGSLRAKGKARVAVGLDMWDESFLESPLGERAWAAPFEGMGAPRLILLEADSATLARRYGETRRKHPLTLPGRSREGQSLAQALDLEREILQRHKRAGHAVDTSGMSPNTLKAYMKSFLDLKTSQMDICVESFGFKHGSPANCELVFDARCLPNPYYEPELRHQSGLDEPVRDFFSRHPKVDKMARQIAEFVADWKADYERDHRSYLTIGVGCTGGQHRSVYVAEAARKLLAEMGIEARCNHREQQRWAHAHSPAAPAAKPSAPAHAPLAPTMAPLAVRPPAPAGSMPSATPPRPRKSPFQTPDIGVSLQRKPHA